MGNPLKSRTLTVLWISLVLVVVMVFTAAIAFAGAEVEGIERALVQSLSQAFQAFFGPTQTTESDHGTIYTVAAPPVDPLPSHSNTAGSPPIANSGGWTTPAAPTSTPPSTSTPPPSGGAPAQGGASMLSVTNTLPVPLASLSASPPSILPGQSSTLTWTTSNANVVTLDGTNMPSSGTLVVLPTTTHTYTIVAQNPAGSVSAPATVTVATSTTSDPPATAPITPTTGVTRDPALWPFATNSVWNYPIGSNAKYATIVRADGRSAFLSPNYANYTSTVYISQSTDPLTNFFGFGASDCAVYNACSVSGASTSTFARRAPANLPIAPGEPTLAVVSVDHLTAYEFGPGAGYSDTGFGGLGPGYYNGASPIQHATSYSQTCCDSVNIDLKGPGIWSGLGWPWRQDVCEFAYPCGDMGIYLNQNEEAAPNNTKGVASGTPIGASSTVRAGRVPQIAGTIRQGELANGIHHAMAGGIDAAGLNQYTPGGVGFVWPASLRDGNASQWYGTTGNTYIGTLWAIPNGVNLANVTFNTVQGKNLAYAFQQYGYYIMDNSGDAIWVDYTARNEVPPFGGACPTYPTTPCPFDNDLKTIAGLMKVVTNSHASNDGPPTGGGFKLDGGDGTLNVPLAPPFDAQWGGGNGRSSYFIPRIPRSLWAWITHGMLP